MRRLGEILIEQGTIAPRQLEEALGKQKREPGKLLGQVLIELGYVTEEDIVVALATQFNIPYLPIANFSVDEKVKKLMPPELVRKHNCLPVDKFGNIFTVVISDPTNEEAIHEIERVTQCKVQLFVSTVSEISNMIQQLFGQSAESTASHSSHLAPDLKSKTQNSFNP